MLVFTLLLCVASNIYLYRMVINSLSMRVYTLSVNTTESQNEFICLSENNKKNIINLVTDSAYLEVNNCYQTVV